MEYQRTKLFLQASQQNILLHLLFKHSYVCKQPDEREVRCSSSIISVTPNWSAEELWLDLTCFEPGEKQTSAEPALNYTLTENKEYNYFPFFFKSETLTQAMAQRNFRELLLFSVQPLHSLCRVSLTPALPVWHFIATKSIPFKNKIS